MANFTQQRKFTTRKPTLKVEAGLDPGSYIFELVVTDSSGNRSKAGRLKVDIVRIRVVGPIILEPGVDTRLRPVIDGRLRPPIS